MNRIIFLIGWKIGLHNTSQLGLHDDGIVQQLLQHMPEGSKIAVVMVQRPTTEPPFDVVILSRDGDRPSNSFGRGVAANGEQGFAWLSEQLPHTEVNMVALDLIQAELFARQCPMPATGHIMSQGDNPLTSLVSQLSLNDRKAELERNKK